MTPLVLIAALAFVLQNGLNALRIILNNTFEQRVIFDLRSDRYSHIQMLPLRWFDNRATGDLITRILEDVNSVERMLIDGIEQGVVAVFVPGHGCSRSAPHRLSLGWFHCRFCPAVRFAISPRRVAV